MHFIVYWFLVFADFFLTGSLLEKSRVKRNIIKSRKQENVLKEICLYAVTIVMLIVILAWLME
jgi:hypothetical protein